MGNFFQVDLSALAQFIDSLGQSDDHMNEALNAMNNGSVGQIGSDALNSAASDFHDTWQYGVGQIHDKVQDTTKGVKAVHDNYAQVEQAMTDALGKIAAGLGGK
jgi:hypothetical protein